VLRALALSLAAALALSAAAAAVSPAVGLARQLKSSMQSYYAKSGLTFTTVTCTIAAARTTATCKAHFKAPAKQAVGIFTVKVTETTAGNAQTRTVAVTCKDSKTGAKVGCF
jgi:hypothetical protein